MSRLLDYLDKLKAFFAELVHKIENSPAYDSLLQKFEELDPKQQQWIASGARLSVIALFFYLLFSPLIGLWSQKGTLDKQQALLAEMKDFNLKLETQPRMAPPPSDWRNLPANTPESALSSLRGFLESIGLPSGSYKLLASSNGHLQVDIPQLNLRQAQAIVYQVDGWYPEVSNNILNIKVNPDNKTQLTLSLTLKHSSGSRFVVSNDSSSSDEYQMVDTSSRRTSPPPRPTERPTPTRNEEASYRPEPVRIEPDRRNDRGEEDRNNDYQEELKEMEFESDFRESRDGFEDVPVEDNEILEPEFVDPEEDLLPPPPLGADDF